MTELRRDGEVRYHHGERFCVPPLPASKLADGRLVRGVANQVKAADAFQCPDASRGVLGGERFDRVFALERRFATELRAPEPHSLARDGLRVKPTILRRLVFRGARRRRVAKSAMVALRSRSYGIPVMIEARGLALRARFEEDAENAPILRRRALETILASGAVGRDPRPTGTKLRGTGQDVETWFAPAAVSAKLSTCATRASEGGASQELRHELRDGRRRAFDLDVHSGGRVANEAVQRKTPRESVHKGSETDALNQTMNVDGDNEPDSFPQTLSE